MLQSCNIKVKCSRRGVFVSYPIKLLKVLQNVTKVAVRGKVVFLSDVHVADSARLVFLGELLRRRAQRMAKGMSRDSSDCCCGREVSCATVSLHSGLFFRNHHRVN